MHTNDDIQPDEEFSSLDGRDMRVAVLLPHFHQELGLELYKNCQKSLMKFGVKEEDIKLFHVPGALELPLAAQKIIDFQSLKVLESIDKSQIAKEMAAKFNTPEEQDENEEEKSKKWMFDVIIALGVVIEGETDHYRLVVDNTYRALMDIQINHSFPIIFGVLACKTLQQAKERISAKGQNKGKKFALAALMQGNFNDALSKLDN